MGRSTALLRCPHRVQSALGSCQSTGCAPSSPRMLSIADALRQSLLKGGRLEREQGVLDGEELQHEELLARGLCRAGAANEPLNRYCNLFPLDRCRVVLRSGLCDFVNASHVEVPGLPPAE